MRNPSLTARFAVFLSVSLTATSSLSINQRFFLTSQHQQQQQQPKHPSTTPKATPGDLLSLLGPTDQSSKVNPLVSRDLFSCFKFLVPLTPPPETSRPFKRIRLQRGRDENELVWFPPDSILDLARLAVDSGGDPDVIHRALDPTVLPVPDVEGSKECRCELTRTPYGRRFINEELNRYLEFLFELIVQRGPSIGLNVSLNRYDFFHGHLFLATDTGRLGILFHAKEYPAYDKSIFPYNMGYCQKGSVVTYDDSMNLRNILWLAPLPSSSTRAWVAPGVLVVLDARPDGIIYRDLIPEYVDFARTIYEDDFGDVAADANYLNIGESAPKYQIFIC